MSKSSAAERRAAEELAAKQMLFGGHPIRLSGRSGDPYFDTIEDHVPVDSCPDIAARLIPPDGVVFDVGANLGVMTLAFATMAPEGVVYGFEPIPTAFGYLRHNIEQNPGMGRAEAVAVACGARNGTAKMFEPAFSAGSFVVEGQEKDVNQAAMAVKMVTLDTFVREKRIDRVDFVKIDVEGFEMSVLEGMIDTIKRFKPIVYLEFNSYCLIAHARMLPNAFLDRVCDEFGSVFVVNGLAMTPLKTPADRRTALATNLVSRGCVDNLLCIPKGQDPADVLQRLHAPGGPAPGFARVAPVCPAATAA